MEDTKMMLKSPNKDLEKKIKILEADLVQCQANTSAAERARRIAENERNIKIYFRAAKLKLKI
jgi:hypothetical protein